MLTTYNFFPYSNDSLSTKLSKGEVEPLSNGNIGVLFP